MRSSYIALVLLLLGMAGATEAQDTKTPRSNVVIPVRKQKVPEMAIPPLPPPRYPAPDTLPNIAMRPQAAPMPQVRAMEADSSHSMWWLLAAAPFWLAFLEGGHHADSVTTHADTTSPPVVPVPPVINVTPEPSTFVLMASGLVLVVAVGRKKARARIVSQSPDP